MDSTPNPASNQVYLDVCALCRPFDDQQQVRIRLETAAVELILAHIRQTRLQLIVSPVHDAEIEAIADREEGKQLVLLLKQLGIRVSFDLSAARQRAEQLTQQGLGVADAAHLAFAEQAQADFVTVDDRLLRQCRRIKPEVWYGSPSAYCDKENLR
jgi:predicted nucleic acid-binding protein